MTDLTSRIVPLIDLTCLNEDCDEQTIHALCEQAQTQWGGVASVCVFPRFVAIAKRLLKDTSVKVATVCNFPTGDQRFQKTLAEIDGALLHGVDEVDLVMPYSQYFSGERGEVIHYVESCRKVCPEPILLKVILETGAFGSQDMIYAAAKDMIYAGADFIKTSTGKTPVGADLESVNSILKAIKEMLGFQQSVGVKISGGIRTVEQVASYLEMTEGLMGKTWISPHTFRIGASQLLEQLHASS